MNFRWSCFVAAVLVGATVASANAQSISVMGNVGTTSYGGSSGTMTGTDSLAAMPMSSAGQTYDKTSLAYGGSVELNLNCINGKRQNFDGTCSQTQFNGIGNNASTASGSGFAALFDAFYIAFGLTDPGTATASFSGLNTVPKGAGTSNYRMKSAIPLQLGYRVAAPTFGIPVSNLEFQVHGGASFDHYQAGFGLSEAGAPAGPGTTASRTWWQVDPTVGVGARYYLPYGFFTGVDSSWVFSRSQNISAQSPNFASESYTLSTGSKVNTTVLFTFGKQFALR